MAAACPALSGGPGYHHLPTAACHKTFYGDSKSSAYCPYLSVHIAELVRSCWSRAAVLPDRLLSLGCRV